MPIIQKFRMRFTVVLICALLCGIAAWEQYSSHGPQAQFFDGLSFGLELSFSPELAKCVEQSSFSTLLDRASAELLQNHRTNPKVFSELGAVMLEMARVVRGCHGEEERTMCGHLEKVGNTLNSSPEKLFSTLWKYEIAHFNHANGKGDATEELYHFALNWKDRKYVEAGTSLAKLIKDLTEEEEY
eukprot:TRINITY_DN2708_c0_g1_i1.p1 TRINITY_DN2708_c0_g1~~TRINITY_DN2708_c0_g1_i1.p1  ORF type:complete len:186 (+),score=49.28 TRINITY_DN2708_c0_g1_i1:202-759(+)